MKNKITPSLKLLALIGTLCLQTQNVFASATSYPLVCYDNDKNQYSTTTNVSATDSSYNLTDTSGEHIIFPIVTTTNSASSYSTWATACLKKTKTLAGMSLNSTAFIVPSGVLTNSNPLKYFIGQNPSLIKKRLETVLPSLLDSTKDFDQFKKDLNRSSVTLINADGTTASKLLYSTKANQGIFNSVPSNLDSARTTLENKLVTELGLPMGTPVKAAADFIISFENQSALQSLFYQLFAYSKFGALSVNAGSGENYHTLSFSVSPNLKLLTISYLSNLVNSPR